MTAPFRPTWTWSVALASALALLAAAGLDRLAPPPSADVSRGSEEAFAEGLQPREVPPRQGPQRWMGPEAVFRFRNLPPGAGRIEVALHGQSAPVAAVVDGVILGTLPPGVPTGDFPVASVRGRGLDLVLRTDGFVASDGRRLGALVDRVTLRHGAPGWPAPLLSLGFLAVALATLWAAGACGFGPGAALAISACSSLGQALALHPFGIARSRHATTLALLWAGGALLAGVLGRAAERRRPGSARWAFVAILAAVLVQGLAATSPLMVVSDAVFHANKLAAVAAGDFFPTSLTQHARPFRIPYGVSFYALLAPLRLWGLDGVGLVRFGAAASGILASLVLYRLLLPQGGARAGAAVLLLQLLPGVFDVYSYGNLSNVFGQAMTVMFFAWWAAGIPGGPVVGGGLLLLGATAHLSSLIVMAALVPALLAFGDPEGRRDRRRLMAALLGFGLAGLYYLHFRSLILEQVPRLLEGGGQGRGSALGAWGALRLQLLGALGQWGVPALVLAWFGRPRPSGGGLERDLLAFWAAGAALLLPALATPLDVRYLYALTVPVAVAAGTGLCRLVDAGGARRWAGWTLLAAQALLAGRGILEAVLYRYRP